MTQIVVGNKIFDVDNDIVARIDSARFASDRMDGKGKKKTMPMMEDEEMEDEEEYMEDSDDFEDDDFEDEEYVEDDDDHLDSDSPYAVYLDGLDELWQRTDSSSFREVLDHLDALETKIQMLEQYGHTDSDKDDESGIEEAVSERLDAILTAYADAKPFLSSEFKLDGTQTPHAIYTAAIQNRCDGLEINWDSETAVETAFKFLQQQRTDAQFSTAPVTVADALVPRVDMASPSGGRKLKPCTYSKDKM